MADHLCASSVDEVVVYGGTAAISDDVMSELQGLLASEACGGGGDPAS